MFLQHGHFFYIEAFLGKRTSLQVQSHSCRSPSWGKGGYGQSWVIYRLSHKVAQCPGHMHCFCSAWAWDWPAHFFQEYRSLWPCKEARNTRMPQFTHCLFLQLPHSDVWAGCRRYLHGIERFFREHLVMFCAQWSMCSDLPFTTC